MQHNIIQCKDKELYYIDFKLMESIKVQGDLTKNALLDLVINNPDVFCNSGLYGLRPFSEDRRNQANYDPDLEILTYNGVEYNLTLDESDLVCEYIHARYEYIVELENAESIFLTWRIGVDISEDEIHNYPIDFKKPFASEY